MNTEILKELNQLLTQIDSCSLCDNENLRVEIYDINEDESAFKIECLLCKDELEYYPSEEQYNQSILKAAIESDMLV